MNLHTEERDGCHLIVLSGELNIFHAATLREALLHELNTYSEIAIDLDNLDEMDCSALQTIASFLRSAAAQGKLVRILQLGPVAAEAIALCNLRSEFGLENS